HPHARQKRAQPGAEESNRQQAGRSHRRREIQSDFAPWTARPWQARTSRLALNGDNRETGRQYCIGNPDLKPAEIERGTRSEPSRRKSARADGNHAPSRNCGEGGRTFHRLPDEAQIVNRTIVERPSATMHLGNAGPETTRTVLGHEG